MNEDDDDINRFEADALYSKLMSDAAKLKSIPDLLLFEVSRIRAEAVRAERERCKRVLENLECVNGNDTEIRRQDAIDAIFPDTTKATTN